MNIFARLYPWGYMILFWPGYCFGYAAFILISTGWIHVAANIHPLRWQRVLATRLFWFTNFTIAYLFVTAIVLISTNVNQTDTNMMIEVSDALSPHFILVCNIFHLSACVGRLLLLGNTPGPHRLCYNPLLWYYNSHRLEEKPRRI